MSAEPWHIDPASFASLAQGLASFAEAGTGPSVSEPLDMATFANAINAPMTEYSRRAQKIGSVAVINISGTLEPEPGFYSRWMGGTACSELRTDLRNADADTTISTIVLWIDCPGGRASGAEETAKLIQQIATRKTVVAYCRNLCASGGYYLASSA